MHPKLTAAPMKIDAAVPFWTALITRYHPGGTLAQEQKWSDGYGVTHYEVENEPDLLPWPGSWEVVPRDYALFLSGLSPAIKAIEFQRQAGGSRAKRVGR